ENAKGVDRSWGRAPISPGLPPAETGPGARWDRTGVPPGRQRGVCVENCGEFSRYLFGGQQRLFAVHSIVLFLIFLSPGWGVGGTNGASPIRPSIERNYATLFHT